MSDEITPYLGLILSSDLTRESKINLRKIDTIAAVFYNSQTSGAGLRSAGDINIVSDASELGGGGNGPTIELDVAGNAINFASDAADLAIDFGGATATSLTVPWALLTFADSSVLDILDYVTETQSQINSNTNVISAAAHIIRTDNPHSVTAAQVDAYTIAQVDALIDGRASDAELAAHVNDTTNPHSVTAAQTGAYQTTEVDALLLLKANKSVVDSHIADTSVHGVSGDVVGTTDTQVLSNKTINASVNTISNITNDEIKSDAAIDGTKITPDFGSQVVKTTGSFQLSNGTWTTDIKPAASGQAGHLTFYFPSADGTAGQVLTTDGAGNWTWASVMTSVLPENNLRVGDAGGAVAIVDTSSVGDVLADSVTGLTIKAGAIVNADINASAAIDASKIGAGSVSNTEFGYLDGVTSSIQTQFDDISTATVPLTKTGTPTTLDVIDDANTFFLSAGLVSGGGITTDDVNDEVSIANGEVYIRTSASHTAELIYTTFTGGTLSIPDGTTRYVYVDYNAGSPNVGVTDDITSIPCQDTCVLYVCSNWNGSISHTAIGNYLNDHQAKEARKSAVIAWLEHGYGAALSSPSTTTIALTAGGFYVGHELQTTAAFDTSAADTFTAAYRDGLGAWTYVDSQTALSTAKYDDGSGTLADLNNNKFGVHWVYLDINTPDRLLSVYGTAEYPTLAEAQAAGVPSVLPPAAQAYSTAKLVGKVIVKQGVTDTQDVQSPFEDVLVSSTPVTHNNLAGLDVGDYQHLTAAQDAKLNTNTLTAERVLIADASGYVATSDITTTELDYLDGASSNIQAQLDVLAAVNTDTLEPTGFVNRTDSTLSFDNGTRTVAITPAVTSFDFYIRGTKYTKSSAQSIVIPNTTDTYYVYFDNTGTLQYSTSVPDFTNTSFAALLYWNATTGDWFLGEERHGITMDGATHGYLHNTRGAAYASGLAVSGYNTGSDTAADIEFDISAGVFYDEDIRNTPTGLTAGDNWHKWYRSGAAGDWKKDTATSIPTFYDGGINRPLINILSGGVSWTQTPVTANYYFNTYVVATNEADTNGLILLSGQEEYSSQAAAEAETISGLSLGSLPSPETVPLYQITYQYKTSYTNNDARVVIASVTDLRNTGSLGVSATPSNNHDALAGLQGGAAGEYFHLTTAQHTSLVGNLRYEGTFDATTSWGSSAVGADGFTYYTITITAATHGLSSPASVCVYEDSTNERVYLDTFIDESTKDVSFRVEDDFRFAGNYRII